MIRNTTIQGVRGDTITIPILAELNDNATYRAQMREYGSSSYYTIDIDVDSGKMTIPPAQSSTMNEGTWYVELEQTLDAVVSTIQKTIVFLLADITQEPDLSPSDWAEEGSYVVGEIATRKLIRRTVSGDLEDLFEEIDTETAAANAAAASANSAATSANNAASAANTAASEANTARDAANSAATDANNAASNAQNKANAADAATAAANAATTATNNATSVMVTVTDEAAEAANNAASEASNQANAASTAASTANQAATDADNAAASANSAAASANSAATSANNAASAANTAASEANTARDAANSAASNANNAATNADESATAADNKIVELNQYDNLLNNLEETIDNFEDSLNNRIDTITYDNTLKTFTTTDNYFTADILNNMKLAVMDRNNNVKYYLDTSDVRFKENGEPANIYGFTTDTVKNIGGTDYTILASDFGTVRVENQAFYWKYDRNGSGNNVYSLSKYFFSGSERYKAFRAYNSVTGEVEDTDYSYVDRYEGVLFDASENKPVNGVYIDVTISADSATKAVTFETPVQYLAAGDVLKDTTGVLGAANAVYTVASVTLNAANEATGVVVNEVINDVVSGTSISLRNDIDLANDYMMSVSGYKPVTYVSGDERDALYQNWSGDITTHQHTVWQWQMQLLFSAIKYGTMNMQSQLGTGKTGNTADYRYVSVTGLADADGITDGVENTTNDQFAGYSLLNAIEQAWGNVWNGLTAVHFSDWKILISENNNVYGTPASYEDTGHELPHVNGYWGELQNFKLLFPATVDGGSNDEIGDYLYQNSGEKVGSVGGALYYASPAGPSLLYGSFSTTTRTWYLGGRGGSSKS